VGISDDTVPARLARGAQRSLAALIGGLMGAMVVLNVANVVARRVIGSAIPAADELMVFGMVWLVFLGVILVTGQDRHLRFDILSRTLTGRWKDVHGAITDLLLAALAAYVATQSWDVVGRLIRFDQRSMAAGIPMAIPHAAVFVGLAGTALLAAARAVFRLAAIGRPG